MRARLDGRTVGSNDWASRRERPSRPWATSTRDAWAMGLNCVLLRPSGDPDPDAVRAGRGPRPLLSHASVHHDHTEPAGDAELGGCASTAALASVSWVDAGATVRATTPSAKVGRPRAAPWASWVSTQQVAPLAAGVRDVQHAGDDPADVLSHGRPRLPGAHSPFITSFRCTSVRSVAYPIPWDRLREQGRGCGWAAHGSRTQRKPTWFVELRTAWPCRAAGR
jgi:hypothetical protein